MKIFQISVIFAYIFLSTTSLFANNLETCALGPNGEVQLFRIDNFDYANIELAVKQGKARFRLAGIYKADVRGIVKIDGLAEGYYQMRFLTEGKLVRSQNFSNSGKGFIWIECLGEANPPEEVCSILNPWITDCLIDNYLQPIQECQNWCKSSHPNMAVPQDTQTNKPAKNDHGEANSDFILEDPNPNSDWEFIVDNS